MNKIDKSNPYRNGTNHVKQRNIKIKNIMHTFIRNNMYCNTIDLSYTKTHIRLPEDIFNFINIQQRTNHASCI